jgi:hypothetical protein
VARFGEGPRRKAAVEEMKKRSQAQENQGGGRGSQRGKGRSRVGKCEVRVGVSWGPRQGRGLENGN